MTRLHIIPCLLILALSIVTAQCAGAADLDGAIAIIVGEDKDASLKAMRSLTEASTRVVPVLVDMIGTENDAKARRVLHGLALYVSAQGSRDDRMSYNNAVCEQLTTDRSFAVKDFLIGQLHFSGGDDVVGTLEGLLSHADLYEPARQALAAIGTRRATIALERALRQANAERRVGLIQALGFIGSSRSVTILIEEAASENEAVKIASFQALGAIGDARAERVIRDSLYVGPLNTRRAATDAYLKIADRLADSGSRTLPGIAYTTDRARDMYTRVIQASHDPAMRYAAEKGLSRLGECK